MKCYNVFYILLLEPTTIQGHHSHTSEPLPPVEIHSQDEFFIEAILDYSIHYRKL
jgi:hypothetical protein